MIFGLTLAAPETADAGCWGGCAVGAGILGGIMAGAIIGSAVAAGPAPASVYIAPRPAGPNCYYTRQPMWDPYMGAYRPGPRVLVCP